jgi:uncharacterized protein YecT (DUF1311 family)
MVFLNDVKRRVNCFHCLWKNNIVLTFCLFFVINISSAHADCYDTAMTQYDINQCAFKHYEHNKHLIDAFLQKQTNLNQLEKASLLEAFNTYQTYINQQCNFNTRGSIGGSAHNMALFNCNAELLHNYLNHLQQQAQCVEGDLSCSKLQ